MSTNRTGRLIIASNRLLVTVSERDDAIDFGPSAGGLVIGLSAYLELLKSPPTGAPYV